MELPRATVLKCLNFVMFSANNTPLLATGEGWGLGSWHANHSAVIGLKVKSTSLVLMRSAASIDELTIEFAGRNSPRRWLA